MAEQSVVWGHPCPQMVFLGLQGAALGGAGLGKDSKSPGQLWSPAAPSPDLTLALPAYLGQVPPGRGSPGSGWLYQGPEGRNSAFTSQAGVRWLPFPGLLGVPQGFASSLLCLHCAFVIIITERSHRAGFSEPRPL